MLARNKITADHFLDRFSGDGPFRWRDERIFFRNGLRELLPGSQFRITCCAPGLRIAYARVFRRQFIALHAPFLCREIDQHILCRRGRAAKLQSHRGC